MTGLLRSWSSKWKSGSIHCVNPQPPWYMVINTVILIMSHFQIPDSIAHCVPGHQNPTRVSVNVHPLKTFRRLPNMYLVSKNLLYDRELFVLFWMAIKDVSWDWKLGWKGDELCKLGLDYRKVIQYSLLISNLFPRLWGTFNRIVSTTLGSPSSCPQILYKSKIVWDPKIVRVKVFSKKDSVKGVLKTNCIPPVKPCIVEITIILTCQTIR